MHTTMAQKPTKKLIAVDLFCGVGGTTLGLKKAGFKVIGAVDNMPEAVRGYKMNHSKVVVFNKDITKLSPRKMMEELNIEKGEVDLLVGCPPCQGFSRLRLKYGSNDKRNDLIFQYVRFVRALSPKTIMLENVAGLDSDWRIEKVKKSLKRLDYNIEYSILNASDFEVPQRRKRFVLIGSKIGKVNLNYGRNKLVTVRQAIEHWQDNTTDELHQIRSTHTKRVQSIIAKIPKDGGSRKELPDEYQLPCHKKCNGFGNVYGRMKWDDVAPTLTGGCTAPSKGRFLHPEQDRAISLREASILQGFPATYQFPMDINKGTIAILIGNAFPPAFIKAQALVLKKHIIQNA